MPGARRQGGFRVFKDVDETGGTVCNTCGINSDGIATLRWISGWRYSDTVRAVADYLRVGSRNAMPVRQVAKPLPHTGDDDERLRQSLNRVWNESIPIADRDAEPARLYLARRGISIAPPETLRFHPSLSYYDGEKKIGSFPAIIAMVSGASGNPVTIHRTYLTPDGKKAPVESPKKLMGYPKDRKIIGGAIRLTEADAQVIAVAEGLETSLAVMEGTGLPVWCTVNALLLENSFRERDGAGPGLCDKDRATEQHPKGHGQEAAKQLVPAALENGDQGFSDRACGKSRGTEVAGLLDILDRDGEPDFRIWRRSMQPRSRGVRRCAMYGVTTSAALTHSGVGVGLLTADRISGDYRVFHARAVA
jgi:hypothetical protein